MQAKIHNKQLLIKLKKHEKFFGFRGNFSIPLKNIKSSKVVGPQIAFWAIRFPAGTHLPGVIRAGHYWSKEFGREWWYVTKSNKVQLELILKDEVYGKVVLGFESESDVPKELLKLAFFLTKQ